ncbi:hypoxanthine phosphoribosyltransferase [Culicoidibacter larvae]|uniref:Hypoxanthine phosphoribosyltransferase n=1 Tax=Culicoidibacter larvae TaxID=2579976 RepID=A0A5R8QJ69_9FIRM|nr:hypoxanthine phosphoribosyltransferase [Culicoidibacter larvae]TLG77297.1 hypoxanthine phosphoribosyltransferase [Culicoidibacter larvae]
MQNVERVLISEAEIEKRNKELGELLTKEYADKENPIFVGVLKGAQPFMSDVLKHVELVHIELDYMRISSYKGTESTNELRVLLDLTVPIEGRDVLIIEDIVDTGQTLKKLMDILELRNPKSLKVLTLLDKPERRTVEIEADYVGFTIPNEFVIGYGMDFDEHYRTLNYIGIYKSE